MFTKIRKFENLHIVLWLLKDTCWVMSFRTAGMIMVLPTIGVAMFITWKMREHRAELFHNLAVCFWIAANSIWMIGEFFYNDGTRPFAMVFFIAGILCVAYYYLGLYPRKKSKYNAARVVGDVEQADSISAEAFDSIQPGNRNS